MSSTLAGNFIVDLGTGDGQVLGLYTGTATTCGSVGVLMIKSCPTKAKLSGSSLRGKKRRYASSYRKLIPLCANIWDLNIEYTVFQGDSNALVRNNSVYQVLKSNTKYAVSSLGISNVLPALESLTLCSVTRIGCVYLYNRLHIGEFIVGTWGIHMKHISGEEAKKRFRAICDPLFCLAMLLRCSWCSARYSCPIFIVACCWSLCWITLSFILELIGGIWWSLSGHLCYDSVKLWQLGFISWTMESCCMWGRIRILPWMGTLKSTHDWCCCTKTWPLAVFSRSHISDSEQNDVDTSWLPFCWYLIVCQSSDNKPSTGVVWYQEFCCFPSWPVR